MSTLTDVEAQFVLCENFIETVNGDGFSEYFSTAFSRYCVETVKYLELIGAKTYAKCLSEAINLFPKDFDFSNETQTEDYIDRYEEHFDKFDEIESKIYDCEEDVQTMLADFIKDNNLQG
ncbi:MAG: DMP19 family protein [Faecalibacterium sp.]|nr:DMP19 family protein [Ruminococcus sp.]MCM1391594.1 DMP19 family protein [Ruminococcus sp.]MCM1486492.1 DMP19 family protein [Faecalibacterium sp.]